MKLHENGTQPLSWIVTCCVLAGAATLAAQSAPPFRAFSAASDAWIEFEPMLDDLAKADVVLVGEQHDDAAAHTTRAAMLDGIGKRRDNVVLSLEMFERDVQEPLDHFSMGHIDEASSSGCAPVAALRDRLQAARRSRDREELAGDRRQRAAADRGRSVEGRPRGPRRPSRTPTRSSSRATCSARPATTISRGLPRRWRRIPERRPQPAATRLRRWTRPPCSGTTSRSA